MRYTDIAWDFDGTLFDSYPNCIRAFRQMLNSYGYDEETDALKREMLITIRHARQFFAEKYGLDPDEMNVRYKHFEGFHPELVRPYPQVEEVLRKIKESGRRNHLYTNRNVAAVRYLDHYGFTQYFDGLITSELQKKLKPSPDGAYILRDRYQIPPGKLLMVGDRAVDIDSVKPLGYDGCYYNTNRLAVPENADFTLETDQLIDLLDYI